MVFEKSSSFLCYRSDTDLTFFMADHSQKVVYECRPIGNRHVEANEIPFIRLLNGKEPINNVKLRYNLFKRNWSKQTKSIEHILNKSDKLIYRNIKSFLCNDLAIDDRINTVFVHFGANIANHSRLTKNLSDSIIYKEQIEDEKEKIRDDSICLVQLNSKAHTTMDQALRAIEVEVMKVISKFGLGKGKIRNRKLQRYHYEDDDEEDDDQQSQGYFSNDQLTRKSPNFIKMEKDEDEDMENYTNAIDDTLRRSRRLRKVKTEEGASKHLENIESDDMHRLARANTFTDLNELIELLTTVNVRLVVFIENCDSMRLEIVHKLIELLWKYKQENHIGLIIGISTPFEIFEDKIPILLLNLTRTKTFSVDNSSEAINEIMEDLLLNINDTYNSLIFDPMLVLKFLKIRHEMSISQFYNFMKSIYMKHYFSEPTSIFWTKKFTSIELTDDYFHVFSRLPSVMQNGKKLEKEFLKGILDEDFNVIGKYLRINLNKLINWRFNFRSIFDFFNFIQGEYLKENKNERIWVNNLHLFELLFSNYYEARSFEDIKWNKLEFLKPIWEDMRGYHSERLDILFEEITEEDQFEFITSRSEFPANLSSEENFLKFIECIENGVSDQIKSLDLSNQSFKEICVIDLRIEESLKMWFSPNMKDNFVDSLDHVDKKLFSSLHWENTSNSFDWSLFKVFEPSMSEIYRTYKDAGIVFNVYDFYHVYKEGVIDRAGMIESILEKLQSELDDQPGNQKDAMMATLSEIHRDILNGKSARFEEMMLSWFLRGFQELERAGMVKRRKGKALAAEKLVWKGI